MNAQENIDYIKRVLKVIDGDFDSLFSGLVEDDSGRILFEYNSSDLYGWGYSCSDVVLPEDLELFEQTVNDVKSVEGNKYELLSMAEILFDCRLRKSRPQGAYYEYIPEYLVSLFDDCGEERKAGMGDPYTREQGIAKRLAKKIQPPSQEPNKENL